MQEITTPNVGGGASPAAQRTRFIHVMDDLDLALHVLNAVHMAAGGLESPEDRDALQAVLDVATKTVKGARVELCDLTGADVIMERN